MISREGASPGPDRTTRLGPPSPPTDSDTGTQIPGHANLFLAAVLAGVLILGLWSAWLAVSLSIGWRP